MPYQKPGVTVKQVQTTSSPNLSTPSIYAAITGEAYNIVEMDEQTYSAPYDETNGEDYVLLGLKGAADGSAVEGNSIVVQLYHLTLGYKHLNLKTDTEVSLTTNTVNIASGITGFDGATVKIWYREKNTNADNFVFLCNGVDDIKDQYGAIHPWNPIGYGLNVALSNAGSSVYGVAVDTDTDPDHTLALEMLEGKDVYALAPMTNTGAVLDNYPAHCTSMSSESNKRERICFLNPLVAWKNDADGTASTWPTVNKDNTAAAEAANTEGSGTKRHFSVFPDTAYAELSIPMGMLDVGYFTDATNKTWNGTGVANMRWTSDAEDTATDAPAFIYFNGTQVFDDVTYYGDTKLTAARMATLKASDSATHVNVLMPVPGYFMCAGNAGLVSQHSPSQGFTNMSVGGAGAQTKGGADVFSQSQLDTIAAGGRYIMEQLGSSAPIMVRHQTSTDRSSTETQELSITKAIDYVSKYVRDGVKPYIGKFNITASFLKLVKTVLNAQGAFLRAQNILDDFKVVKVEQNPSQKDQVLVEISVLVQYPVNYIKISLQF